VPANLIGIDTGKKGLVETGVALPGALAKGAIKGVGAIVGKKNDAAAVEATAGERPAADGGAVEATAAEADAKPAPSPGPAPQTNPLMQGMFGAKPQQGGNQPADATPAKATAGETPAKATAAEEPAEELMTDGWAADAAAGEVDVKPAPAPASAPPSNPLMQGTFGN